ncbi:hypothetical protein Taro_032983 [Colocasia esculenta]|uniref:Uncharacterized protein n=1 Tax=Colocasia esculenta TaxID=4460 RepID=A0A843W3G3_COLES|nr:hypothetical protein [Colocasia esculenta]
MDAKNMLTATPLPPTHSRRHTPRLQPTVDVQRTEHQHRSITNPGKDPIRNTQHKSHWSRIEEGYHHEEKSLEALLTKPHRPQRRGVILPVSSLSLSSFSLISPLGPAVFARLVEIQPNHICSRHLEQRISEEALPLWPAEEEEGGPPFISRTVEKGSRDKVSIASHIGDALIDRVKCVDTVHGRVDTRPSFQEIHLSDWDSVSTQSVVVSTLDPASRRPFCAIGTVCRHTQW